jgi:predicted anti-sigma-YlaC factor YlaD
MSDDFEKQQREMVRAKKLYLRGTGILLDGLDQKYAGFADAFHRLSVDSYLPRFKKDDVPGLYWMTAGTMAAYSLNPFDLELGVSLPVLRQLIDRAYQLDPDFNNGAIDDFYVLLLASLPPEMGGDKSLAEEHFRRAVEKSKGLAAGPYISYAESICIPAQDYEHFKENIEKALAVDPSKDPANRLVNIINQRKAQYLLDNASRYFIDIGDEDFDWGDDEDFKGEWW